MKLYEVPPRTWIKVAGEKIYFDHPDGMWSYCQDEGGNVVRVSINEEVELLEEKQMKIETLKQVLGTLEEINKLSTGENAICLPAEIDTAMELLREAIVEYENSNGENK